MATINPDEETKQRIKNLAYVGKALYQISSDSGFETDYFVAKESLNKFREGIEKLNLDEESHKGMMDLIAYLQGKIDKRMNASAKGTELD